MSEQDQTRLQDHVDSIANKLTEGFGDELNYDDEPLSAYDYLEDALDIQYIVNGKGEYLAARVLVAFGGPNIWVNTQTNTVEGYSWGNKAFASFNDEIGLDEVLEELWNCK